LTGRVKRLEQTFAGLPALTLERSSGATRPQPQPAQQGRRARSQQDNTQLNVARSAQAATARVNSELRALASVPEIHVGNSSEDEVELASGRVKRSPESQAGPSSTAAKIGGFSSPYRPQQLHPGAPARSPAGKRPPPPYPGTGERLFPSVAASSPRVVDRMRPKTSAKPEADATPEARGSPTATARGTQEALAPNFSSPESRKKLADEYISILRTPEAKGTRPSRHESAGEPRRQSASIPPRRLPLLGVQIGRYVEHSAAHPGSQSCSPLSVNIRYVQRTLEIGGLRGGDEHMKIDSSDIATMEHMSREGLSVLRITPVETIENIFSPDVFDPSSSDPTLRDIFLCLRLPAASDGTPIQRLLLLFQKDIRIWTMDAETFRVCTHEFTKPPSIDIVSSDDDGVVTKGGAPSNRLDTTAVSPPVTSEFWASVDEQRGRLGISALNSKRKSQATLLDASTIGATRGAGLYTYKLRRTRASLAPNTLLLSKGKAGGDEGDDEDDSAVQCHDFGSSDHTLRFIYPRAGPKPISVTGSDISRLYKDTYLNDTILEFYIRYIGENLRASNPQLHEQCHFFNTFFHRKLSQCGKGALAEPKGASVGEMYQQVKKWTANVDIFEKRYLFVPIHENTHWYLAIIANAKAVLSAAKPPTGTEPTAATRGPRAAPAGDAGSGSAEEPAKPTPADGDSDVEMADASRADPPPDCAADTLPACPEPPPAPSKSVAVTVEFMGEGYDIAAASYMDPLATPSILVLDSLGNRHQATFRLLRSYIRAEASWRHGVELSEERNVGKYAKVPLQDNFCDCGVFLLQYIEEFLKDPVGFVALVLGGVSLRTMFTTQQMEQKRLDMLDLATGLANDHKQQHSERPEPQP
ncbi:hypothetical protein H4R21_003720, partial [Coemansia helicoidea]